MLDQVLNWPRAGEGTRIPSESGCKPGSRLRDWQASVATGGPLLALCLASRRLSVRIRPGSPLNLLVFSTCIPFSRCQSRHRPETVSKLALAGQRRRGSRTMLVRLSVQLRQCFPHHVQLRQAVALEHLRVALPQHLRHEMIRHSPRAQPGCKRVALIPSSELQAFFCSYPLLTRLPVPIQARGGGR